MHRATFRGWTFLFTLVLAPSALAGEPAQQACNFIEISGGRSHFCGLREDGSAETPQARIFENAPDFGSFKSVSVGTFHACAIRDDDTVECWGSGRPTLPACAQNPACGNLVVDEGEDCDDGDKDFRAGEGCNWSCRRVPCGRPINPDAEEIRVTDAAYALRAAVGAISCSLSVCDVNNSGQLTASDALALLKKSVGHEIEMSCPA